MCIHAYYEIGDSNLMTSKMQLEYTSKPISVALIHQSIRMINDDGLMELSQTQMRLMVASRRDIKGVLHPYPGVAETLVTNVLH